jgi:hypothetical protein
MAKALLGHIGGTDLRMSAEIRRLQQRVRDLEAQLTQAHAENDTLSAALRSDEFDQDLFAAVTQREPALT